MEKSLYNFIIHKKGETDNPASFRPITLESIRLKVFTSYLRNKTFQFLAENNYIEQNTQKVFTPKLSGTLEHTAQMANIINKARTKTTVPYQNTTRFEKCIWCSSSQPNS